MQLFNRNVSVRGLTVFAFEVVLISGSMALAAGLHGSFAADGPNAAGTKWCPCDEGGGNTTRPFVVFRFFPSLLPPSGILLCRSKSARPT